VQWQLAGHFFELRRATGDWAWATGSDICHLHLLLPRFFLLITFYQLAYFIHVLSCLIVSSHSLWWACCRLLSYIIWLMRDACFFLEQQEQALLFNFSRSRVSSSCAFRRTYTACFFSIGFLPSLI
jgi:hypothetical protein